MSVCDFQNSTFHYAQRRSKGGFCNDSHRVWVADWSVHQSGDTHHLVAQSHAYRMNLSLLPAKPVAHNHHDHSFTKTPGTSTRYHSITRMHVAGEIEIQGKSLAVSGTAWMDCERGPFKFNQNLRGWDWFAIQTKDGHELMVYRLRNAKGQTTSRSIAITHDPNGYHQISNLDNWYITPTDFWTSEHTGIRYPVQWHLCEETLGVDLKLDAVIRCSEIDARGSACTIYWEGPATAKGHLLHQPTHAQAYMELTGYNDARHTGEYDYTHENLPLLDWLYCSARYFFKRNGVTLKQNQQK